MRVNTDNVTVRLWSLEKTQWRGCQRHYSSITGASEEIEGFLFSLTGSRRIHYSSITGASEEIVEKSLGNSKGCSGADCPEMVDFTEIFF
jgi:hypothetical protein